MMSRNAEAAMIAAAWRDHIGAQAGMAAKIAQVEGGRIVLAEIDMANDGLLIYLVPSEEALETAWKATLDDSIWNDVTEWELIDMALLKFVLVHWKKNDY